MQQQQQNKVPKNTFNQDDADPGPWDLCVVAAMDKFTQATEILWRKRDGMATLLSERGQEGQRAQPLPGQAFIAFLGTLPWMILIYYAQVLV